MCSQDFHFGDSETCNNVRVREGKGSLARLSSGVRTLSAETVFSDRYISHKFILQLVKRSTEIQASG